jgi:hypothetical protein
VDRLPSAPKGNQKWKKRQEALRRLRNERQRDLLLRDIIERYNKEQLALANRSRFSSWTRMPYQNERISD